MHSGERFFCRAGQTFAEIRCVFQKFLARYGGIRSAVWAFCHFQTGPNLKKTCLQHKNPSGSQSSAGVFGPYAGRRLWLFLNLDGVDRAAVGGTGGPVVLGLIRIGQDGGDPVVHAEDAGGSVGAHSAADALAGIHGNSHKKPSFLPLWPAAIIIRFSAVSKEIFTEWGTFFPGEPSFLWDERRFWGNRRNFVVKSTFTLSAGCDILTSVM
jgi:hypothetical protein